MGVLNLSPESFYQGSVYDGSNLISAAKKMIKNGAKILDLGGRSTAPWSKVITVVEEEKRLSSVLESLCNAIPREIILSIDTQYSQVAKKAYNIAKKCDRNIIINDVSCFKTDPSLLDFVCDTKLPIILMASRNIPGDILTMDEIIDVFEKTIKKLKLRGYNENHIILDPGIGKWIPEKEPKYDIRIINDLEKLRELKKPILVALSRKSFIGAILDISDPFYRLNGTLSATAISVYNGAHIIRTHDVTSQLSEIIKVAEELRKLR